MDNRCCAVPALTEIWPLKPIGSVRFVQKRYMATNNKAKIPITPNQ